MEKFMKKIYLRNFLVIIAGFVLIQILSMTGMLNRYYMGIIIAILIAIVSATSLNLSTGMMGQLVLGHAAFIAIGAYSAGLMGIALKNTGLPGIVIFIISAITAGIMAMIAGILVGTPALKLRGDYLGIMTLGVGEIVRVIIINIPSVTNGAQGLTGIPTIMNFPIAYWTTVISVLCIVLFITSRHGRAILSIRENEIASEAVGIPVFKYKIMGFAVAAFFAGIAGAIYAFQYAVLVPSSFGFIRSVEIFVIVVLGGMGSITGCIIAAIVLTFLPEYLREFEKYRLLIYSLLLVVIMLKRPQGLLGTKEMNLTKIIDKSKSLLHKTFKKGSGK